MRSIKSAGNNGERSKELKERRRTFIVGVIIHGLDAYLTV